MIGRERELQRFRRTLDTGAVAGLVLAGSAGVGKTALANECLELATADGFVTRRITGTRAASSIPLGAVASLLPPRPTTAMEQADLLRHAASALADDHSGHRVALLIDDAHLLDDASATFVHQLANTRTAFLIVTVRTPADTPDPITAMWKDGLAERIEVGPLHETDTAALAAEVLGGPLSADANTTIYKATQGNPLFVLQLVAGAQRAGALRAIAGTWHLEARLPLPDDIVDAVDARLADLDPGNRAILELVALGEPIGASMLEDLAGEGGSARLERLEADGFIVADLAGQRLEVRLAHPLYGEVLRANAPRSWANRARLMLADAVEAHGMRQRDDPLRVATWRLEANETIPDHVAVRAAYLALQRFDSSLAERLLRQTTDGGGFEGRVLLSQASTMAGRADDALAILDRISLDGIAEADLEATRARLTAVRFDVLTYMKGRYVEAIAMVNEAESVTRDVSLAAELASRRGLIAALAAQPEMALDSIARYRGLDLTARARVWVNLVLAMAADAQGRFDDALVHVADGKAALGEQVWEPTLPQPTMFTFMEAQELLHAGRLDAAIGVAEGAAARERIEWSEQGLAWIRMVLAAVHRLCGRPVEAAAMAEASAATFLRVGATDLASLSLAELAAACATSGDADRAAEVGRQVEALPTQRTHQSRAMAWALIANGERRRGTDLLLEVAESRRGRDAGLELYTLLDVTRLGRADAAAKRLQQLAKSCQGELAPAAAAFATASAAGDPEGLEQASAAMTALGCHLVAVEAMTAAAAAYTRKGNRARARAAETKAAELAAGLEGVRTPGLLDPGLQAALTGRELEVSSLAAGGLGNRDIAERLGLSARTVEGYLQRIYTKLGASGRDALTAALGSSQ